MLNNFGLWDNTELGETLTGAPSLTILQKVQICYIGYEYPSVTSDIIDIKLKLVRAIHSLGDQTLVPKMLYPQKVLNVFILYILIQIV